MNKRYRSLYVMMTDMLIVLFSYIISLWIRFEFAYSKVVSHPGFFNSLIIVLIVYALGFKLARLEKSIWAKISIDEGIRVIITNVLITTVIIGLKMLGVIPGIPRSVIAIGFLFSNFGSRSS